MKTTIVTGASKGIGFEIARIFLAEGNRVVNLSRSPARDDRIESHHVDFSLSNAQHQITELVGGILEEGEICLVHNAAKLINDSADHAETETFREV